MPNERSPSRPISQSSVTCSAGASPSNPSSTAEVGVRASMSDRKHTRFRRWAGRRLLRQAWLSPVGQAPAAQRAGGVMGAVHRSGQKTGINAVATTATMIESGRPRRQ